MQNSSGVRDERAESKRWCRFAEITHSIYKLVLRSNPVLVDHKVNVRGTTSVVTRVDSDYLHDVIRVSVPTSTEPGLRAVKDTGIMVSGVVANRIGY